MEDEIKGPRGMLITAINPKTGQIMEYIHFFTSDVMAKIEELQKLLKEEGVSLKLHYNGTKRIS